MEILKAGKLKSVEIICNNCNSLLSINKDDLERSTCFSTKFKFPKIIKETIINFYIECPLCKRPIFLYDHYNQTHINNEDVIDILYNKTNGDDKI